MLVVQVAFSTVCLMNAENIHISLIHISLIQSKEGICLPIGKAILKPLLGCIEGLEYFVRI